MSDSSNQQIALVAVMGPTGSGKTTFVNMASGSDLRVGNGLESCTNEIGLGRLCEMFGKSVLLIDTPGFDDTSKTQADILREIAGFLKNSYEDGRKLTGIIYMHRISDVRVGGIARENFRLFRKTCGDDAMKNVVIVTTMWGEVQLQRGEERERELSSKSIFFLDALDHGARMLRHHNTVESARAIMRVTLANIPETLQMQHELVTENKTVVETEVGIDVYNGLRRQEQTHQANMKDIYGEMRSMREALVGGIGREAHRKEVEELRSIVTNLAKKVAEIDEERKKLAEENNQQKETIKRLMEVISRQEQENKSSRQRREKQGNTPKKTDRAMETQTKTPEIRVHTIRVVAEERPSMERTPENKKDDSWGCLIM